MRSLAGRGMGFDSCAPWRGGGRGWIHAFLGGERVGVGLLRSSAERGYGLDLYAPWRGGGRGCTHALLGKEGVRGWTHALLGWEEVRVGLMRSLKTLGSLSGVDFVFQELENS